VKGRQAPPPDWRARLASLEERRWFRWGGEALVVLGAVLVIGLIQTRHHLGGGERPAATFRTLGGAAVTLDSLRGQPVALAFWAPWCQVCAAQADNLSRAARWAGDRGRVIPVAAAFSSAAEVRAYVERHGLAEPVLLADEETVRAFRVEAFPSVYFLDAEGRIKRSAAGYTTTIGLLARLLF
jgi:thiol-disulfide isomerase/thioredoxin